ncbi:MAG: 50S ribosomal protein L1 [Buchnera aphidicola (Nurudea yanoniella)]
MKKITKKMQFMHTLVKNKKNFDIEEGIELLKKMAISKFNESIDVSINLSINPKKSDQNIRGSTVLPHGIGKIIKVAVFTQEKNFEIAKKCGAEYVGLHDLIEKIQKNNIDFNIAIASVDVMHFVNKLGPVLGPRGLMPNTKLGTVTNDIKTAIKNAKIGQINYKNDKNGIIHTSIGKINFLNKNIQENLHVLLKSLKRLKPKTLKGSYIKKITLSTTMSLGININFNNLNYVVI